MLDARMTRLVTVQELRFPSGQHSLVGDLYCPVDDIAALLVINSATGVPQSYYRAFATWLAETRNIAVLTFDYAGFGRSASGPLRAVTQRMSDWALRDQPAARAEMRRRFPGLPLWVVGHSLGGLLMPMQDGLEHVDRMIAVAAGRVHFSEHPLRYQLAARLFWFGHGPALTAGFGYLPAKLAGLGGEDLPASVYWQWRRWCVDRDFYFTDPLVPEPNWPRDVPVDLVGLSDDQICPVSCVQELAPIYGDHAQVRIIDPDQHGLGPVGHMAMFARRNARLWPRIVPAL
ncbi:MAG: alpha/beta fold hydrolase [Rhodobacteraceae bacterium]|nr:alpha/beta fold hydrolase [Paracoccaceae bacterium]